MTINLLNEINSMLEGKRKDIQKAVKNAIVKQVNTTGKLILEIDGRNVEFTKEEVKAIWKEVI